MWNPILSLPGAKFSHPLSKPEQSSVGSLIFIYECEICRSIPEANTEIFRIISFCINFLETTADVKLPTRISVELRPRNNESWCHVQSLAMNPRVRTTLPLQQLLISLISHLQKKWQLPDVEIVSYRFIFHILVWVTFFFLENLNLQFSKIMFLNQKCRRMCRFPFLLKITR